MKKREKQALAAQGTGELIEKEKQLKEAAWKLRLQKATGQLENPSRLSILRRDIGQVDRLGHAAELLGDDRPAALAQRIGDDQRPCFHASPLAPAMCP